ncbi:GGDEF domain-containing protein [Paenibacillus sp. MMO-177]|uniref:GGDEF domain-containing protein n=1 Tax=Paenibacillus sp. MMO-177 TaxID=3081289 RepID=UPI00301A3118
MTQLFTESQGEVYYSSLSILVLTLLLLQTSRLLIHRKKRAYFTLTVVIGIMLLEQIIVLITGFMQGGAGAMSEYLRVLFYSAFFIGANMGIYQMYEETSKRFKRLSITFLAAAVLLPIIPVAGSLYLLALTAMSVIMVYPLTAGNKKFLVGIVFFTLSSVAHLGNQFFGPLAGLNALDNLMRIGWYVTLFIILFDRVIEILEDIYHNSTHDALTGLHNPYYINTTMAYKISKKAPISIVFIDLDNFKRLNDTFGHEEGDKALKSVASILKEEAEEVGIAGRYGGEEIVLIVEEPEVNMSELTERIRARIENETVVTASIGYVVAGEEGATDKLISEADAAMYKAKNSGKNKVVAYNDLVENQNETAV